MPVLGWGLNLVRLRRCPASGLTTIPHGHRRGQVSFLFCNEARPGWPRGARAQEWTLEGSEGWESH